MLMFSMDPECLLVSKLGPELWRLNFSKTISCELVLKRAPSNDFIVSDCDLPSISNDNLKPDFHLLDFTLGRNFRTTAQNISSILSFYSHYYHDMYWITPFGLQKYLC